MYLEDDEIENLYGEFKNEGVTPPPEAKDFVMNSIGRKSYWRYVWILLLIVGAGTATFLLLPDSKSANEDGLVADDHTPSDQANELSQNEVNSGISKNNLREENTMLQEEGDIKDIDRESGDNITQENQNIVNAKIHLDGGQNANKKTAVQKSNQDKNLKHQGQQKKKVIPVEGDAKIDDNIDYENGGKNKNWDSKRHLQQKDSNIDALGQKDDVKNENLQNKKDMDPKKKLKGNAPLADLGIKKEIKKEEDAFIHEVNKNFDKQKEQESEIEKLNKLNLIEVKEIAFGDEKNIQIDLRESKRVSPISWAMEARVGYSFSDVLTRKDEVNYNTIGQFRNLQTLEARVNGLLDYKSLLVKTGIGYQQDFSNTNYSEDIIEYRRTVVYEELLDSNNNPYNSYLYTFVDTTQVTNNYQLRVSTSYFTIPLQIGYQFRLSSRWNMEVLAGARFAFLMNVDSKYDAPQSMDYLQSIDHGAFQKFRMDATLDLGINYRLTENWSLGVHLPFSIGLNSRLKDSKALNYRIGGLLNLRFHF